MPKLIDLTGQRFGRLLVIKRQGTNHGGAAWLCKCDCGKEVIVRGDHLKDGNTSSCGCLQRTRASEAVTKHNKFGTRLYRVWGSMKYRCNNPKDKEYQSYGGRGITVCQEWQDSFEAFYEWAMSSGYDPYAEYGECTLDRIDPDGNYCPENCRWITLKEQQNNRRNNRHKEG